MLTVSLMPSENPARRERNTLMDALADSDSKLAAILRLGPMFKFSDTWQLVINTSTTIITFLMVFLIQSAQNRDTEALRLKLDAIILSLHSVSNVFVDLDRLNDDELEQLRQKLTSLAES